MNRSERFLKAMEDLVDCGEGWESEIEREAEQLSAEEFHHFIIQAMRATDTTAGIVRNLLINARCESERELASAGGAR